MATEPNHGPSGHPAAADQIASVICRLTDAYLGDSYNGKGGCSQMGWGWRWLNATFGSVTFFSSVLIISLLAPAQSADAALSRFSVLFDTAPGRVAIGLAVVGFPCCCRA